MEKPGQRILSGQAFDEDVRVEASVRPQKLADFVGQTRLKENLAIAVEAARSLPFEFTLTARAENFLHGRPDLGDTIRRLKAFENVGADVLYAPGLPSLDAIREVCCSVSHPVNVVMGLKGPTWSVEELAAAGVKRVSVGGAFARAALGAFMRAAREVKESGTFAFAADAIPHAEVRRFMAEGDRSPETDQTDS